LEILIEVNTAIAVLEIQGPAITEALRQLDRATTMAWKAVNTLSERPRLPPRPGVRLLARNACRVVGVSRLGRWSGVSCPAPPRWVAIDP
jgi:hypothetical protein